MKPLITALLLLLTGCSTLTGPLDDEDAQQVAADKLCQSGHAVPAIEQCSVTAAHCGTVIYICSNTLPN